GVSSSRGIKGPAPPAQDAVPPRSAAQRRATEGGSRVSGAGGSSPHSGAVGSSPHSGAGGRLRYEAPIAPNQGELHKARGTAIGRACVDVEAAEVPLLEVPAGVDERGTRGIAPRALQDLRKNAGVDVAFQCQV